jgi:hypothetical protein
MSETCYMCDKVATTREHVPPQGLFPESKAFKKIGKEIPDMRKNLITVPSCEAHNTAKSNDDAFLRDVLTMCQGTNTIGQAQFLAKVKKSIDTNRRKLSEFKFDNQVVSLKDELGEYETQAMSAVDLSPFNSAIHKIVRALYFHHFKEKWLLKIHFAAEYMFVMDGDNPGTVNENNRIFCNSVDQVLKGEAEHGENKGVFTYKVKFVEDRKATVMRLCFYGNARIFIMLLENE